MRYTDLSPERGRTRRSLEVELPIVHRRATAAELKTLVEARRRDGTSVPDQAFHSARSAPAVAKDDGATPACSQTPPLRLRTEGTAEHHALEFEASRLQTAEDDLVTDIYEVERHLRQAARRLSRTIRSLPGTQSF